MKRPYCPTTGCTGLPRHGRPYCDKCTEANRVVALRAWFDRITKGWARGTLRRERRAS